MNALVPTPLHGEVLPPRAVLAVVAVLHPLRTSHDLVLVPVGSSLAEIVDACARQAQMSRLAGGAHVTIDGHPIPRELWARVRPKERSHVMVRAVPGKGVGGILKSVLQIALVAVAGIFFGPAGSLLTGALGSAVGAAVILGGSLLLGALFPPSTTKAATQEEQYSIASRRNDAHRWGPIPELFGRQRIAPKFATSPYTKTNGNEQDLYQLFVFGLGAMSIEDIRIGDTPIGEYQGVEVQVREGYASDVPQTLVPSQIVQDDFQIEPSQGRPVVRDGADGAVRLELDLLAPQGIGNIGKKDGSLSDLTVQLQVDVVNRDTGRVASSQPYAFTGRTRDAIRRTVPIAVAKGRYFVRLTRISPDNTGDDHLQQVVWTALRSDRDEPVIRYGKPVALVAVKIRASKQLNGAIADLTAVCTKKTFSWDGGQWQPDRQTRSPADAFRHVLQGPGIARPRTNDQIDWPSLEHWADLCRAKGWSFDMFRDFRASVPDTLRDICAAGRAVPIFRDGKWSVAMEDVAAPLVQMFTPRNVEGFTRAITYAELPHAFRCKFVNERKDWIEDELLVYADGFDAFNATLFEQIEFPGVTNPDLVFKHARYRMAERILRRSFYSFTTDAEHLVLARGDRCKVSHYVVHRSAIQGRVLSIEGQTVTLDEPVAMVAGRAYAIETKRATEFATVIATNAVQTVAGETNRITVTGAPPKAGDLFAFGEPTTISGAYRVLRISPGSDLSATIELVDDALGIQNADDGPIDAGPGVVDPVAPIATFRPRNLRVHETIQTGPLGTVAVVRLTWDMLPPPGRSVLSFLVVALGADGTELRVQVGPDDRQADFGNMQSGEWTFRVFAFIEGLGLSNPSDPLTAAINIPWDELGVGLGNAQPDLRYVLEQGPANWDAFREAQERLTFETALGLSEINRESERLNSRTFELDADVKDAGARIIREEIVRERGDEVLAARAERAEARLGTVEGEQDGQAVALETITARVTRTEGGIEAASEALTGVRSQVDDPQTGLSAQGRAIDLIQSISEATRGGVSVTVAGQQLIEARVENALWESAAGLSQEARDAEATTARVITDQRASVDRDRAQAERLDAVTVRMLSPVDGFPAVAAAQTRMRSDIAAQGDKLTLEASRTDGALVRLGAAEGHLDSQSQTLVSHDATLVSQAGRISLLSSYLAGVEVVGPDGNAAVLSRMTAVAAPAGVSARFAMQFRAQAGLAYSDAGWFVDVTPGQPSTSVFDVQRFVITDATSKFQPFRFENGVAYLNALVAGSVLVEGTLTAREIVANGITKTTFLSTPDGARSFGPWHTLMNAVFPTSINQQMVINLTGYVWGFTFHGKNVNLANFFRLRVLRNGSIIYDRNYASVVIDKSPTNLMTQNIDTSITDVPPAGTSTYEVQLLREEGFDANLIGVAATFYQFKR